MISRVHAACISGGRAAQHRQRRRRATNFSQNISFERPCTASEFPGNLVQVKAFDTVIPTSGATWPDRVAGLEGYDSWEQDYGRTFTSASLRETEIDLLVGTRGRRLSTRFSDNGRKRSTRRSSRAPMRGGRDASGTGPGRFVALDIGNAVDRRAAHLPCATALARAGSGANR